MNYSKVTDELKQHLSALFKAIEPNDEEVRIYVEPQDFKAACLFLHKKLRSGVMAFFGTDRRKAKDCFELFCVFLGSEYKKWFSVSVNVPPDEPRFNSIAKDIYSANLFEREMLEMFGILPEGNPDMRSLHLHDEVWPKEAYPLRKDFVMQSSVKTKREPYKFQRIEGDGIFEVPVGPVHAGIIGPGHFRFSVAGEPIVNLEIRLGFTHRGVEKIFENKTPSESVNLSECISGDSAFGHSWAFCRAVEKMADAKIPGAAFYTRAICLELERMYNHLNDIGGMALDVGFSFPAQFASVLKERILRVNECLSGSRYLKGVNSIGGVKKSFTEKDLRFMLDQLSFIMKDTFELKKILYGSVSFMDRVDDTGVLRRKTAEDLGVVGLAGRASGIGLDLRKVFSGGYAEAGFNMMKEERGDCLARLKVRMDEVIEAHRLIKYFTDKIIKSDSSISVPVSIRDGIALGAIEGWRGPILYWIKIDNGVIERCKIVDASFHNWQGLSFAVLGNIIPDFPLCNKSFDLSYAGNDL